jgi:acetoin utilization deacetylase AcuC-like enzyme
MQTGIVIDPRYMDHDMGGYHVESPRRIEAILDMIEGEIDFPFLKITPRAAERREVEWVHDPDYVAMVQSTAGRARVRLDPDTSTSPLSYETAMLAVGGLLRTVDSILAGDIKNAFAPVRPPGHHAESSRAMGFCLFNNVAVAAEYLLRSSDCRRILIVDWDLHHGNGTQNAFFARSDVLYFSIHQFPHYPGTGRWNETGLGQGEGFTINIPLFPGKSDRDYLHLFQHVLTPIARQYEPDFILVSAGFDTAATDPLGGMMITSRGFGAMTNCLKDLAEELCGNRLSITLEGGYDLNALTQGVREVLNQLNGTGPESAARAQALNELELEIAPMIRHFSRFWKL